MLYEYHLSIPIMIYMVFHIPEISVKAPRIHLSSWGRKNIKAKSNKFSFKTPFSWIKITDWIEKRRNLRVCKALLGKTA